MQYGPQAALIAEAFTPRLRYSGASLGYQLASIIAGGPAPLIATWLFATYHSGYAISVYIAVLAVISFIAAAMMPDYTGKDISCLLYTSDAVIAPRRGYAAFVIGACCAKRLKSPSAESGPQGAHRRKSMASSKWTIAGALLLIPVLGFAVNLASAQEPAVAIPPPAQDEAAPAGATTQTIVLALSLIHI